MTPPSWSLLPLDVHQILQHSILASLNGFSATVDSNSVECMHTHTACCWLVAFRSISIRVGDCCVVDDYGVLGAAGGSGGAGGLRYARAVAAASPAAARTNITHNHGQRAHTLQCCHFPVPCYTVATAQSCCRCIMSRTLRICRPTLRRFQISI